MQKSCVAYKYPVLCVMMMVAIIMMVRDTDTDADTRWLKKYVFVVAPQRPLSGRET